MYWILCIFVVAIATHQAAAHGMMLNPPQRSSMWRFGFNVPPNYNDNGLNCGGFPVQWNKNKGKCGICGDAYDASRPRENENGGKYGTGTISRVYTSGGVAPIFIRLTASHMGHFEYQICNLDAGNEEEKCFKSLYLADGSDRYNVTTGPMDLHMKVRLPAGLRCRQCVIRWYYRAGNRWGKCEDGTFAVGCGPQETFRNCADVSIIQHSTQYMLYDK